MNGWCAIAHRWLKKTAADISFAVASRSVSEVNRKGNHFNFFSSLKLVVIFWSISFSL